MSSTSNGQIQPIYTDQYGFQWANIFTVRHGVSTYIYDLDRGFSRISFVDQNGTPFAFDSLHLTTSPTGATSSNMLFGGTGGYHFPVVPSGYYLVGKWNGQNLPINLDSIGASNWWGDGVLPLTVPTTTATLRSSGADNTNKVANANKLEIGKAQLKGKKVSSVAIAKNFEKGPEAKAESK